MDNLSPEERSDIMRRVKSKDTRPETLVRKTLFALGYRYRIVGHGLPFRPDIVFPRKRKAVFVHGCFWHGHEGCAMFRIPKSNQTFWRNKLNENQSRDNRQYAMLTGMGWTYKVIWECELIGKERFERTVISLRKFLDSPI